MPKAAAGIMPQIIRLKDTIRDILNLNLVFFLFRFAETNTYTDEFSHSLHFISNDIKMCRIPERSFNNFISFASELNHFSLFK